MTEIKPPTLGVWAVAATFRSPDGDQDVHVVDVVPGTNQANALAGFVAGFVQATKLDWRLATTACAPVNEAWLQSALSVLRGDSANKVVSLREVEKAPEPSPDPKPERVDQAAPNYADAQPWNALHQSTIEPHPFWSYIGALEHALCGACGKPRDDAIHHAEIVN